ncbi:hypothetical protein EVAR_12606_1 [Eumeta japonica]|uniref:Uncharacterized protein n=1 Tax=Eumeta variegata TaxID=151549 RepID=A0A4C1UF17_EUMVA|nr:hypothetical protein EVAR_12606_1 [Eumeta japonica]
MSSPLPWTSGWSDIGRRLLTTFVIVWRHIKGLHLETCSPRHGPIDFYLAKAVLSHPYPVKVHYVTGLADPFTCYSRGDHSTAPPISTRSLTADPSVRCRNIALDSYRPGGWRCTLFERQLTQNSSREC